MSSFWNKKNILVTGASGFIGSHVVDELLAKGAYVTAVQNKTKIKKQKNLTIKSANLTEFSECLSLMKNIDMVLHFAAFDGGKPLKIQHGADMLRVNTLSVLNMLEAARLKNVEKVLLMSSTEVYPVNQSICKEDGALKMELMNNDDGYTWSKRFLEITAKLYAEKHNMTILVTRAGNIYGPKDHCDRGRVIPHFINLAKQNAPITILGNGKLKKSFLYIDDFVSAVLLLLEQTQISTTVNIASSQYISLQKLAELIISLTQSNSQLQFQTSMIKLKTKKIDITKLTSLTQFKEKITLRQGLEKILRGV